MSNQSLTIKKARDMLPFLNPNPRDFWITIGAAIKSEFGDDGFELWDTWSQQADNYKAADSRAAWASFNKSGITIGTLIHFALRGGYRFANDHPQETEGQRNARILAREKHLQQEAVAAKRQAEINRCKAHQLWADSEPIGSPLVKYLNYRGLSRISNQLPPSIRFIQSLPYWQVEDDKPNYLGSFPAMVAAVTNLTGDVVALHRSYLTNDGHKANIPTVKKLLGSLNGGAIKLSPTDGDDALCLTEGIETGLAVHLSTGLPTWACVSAHGLKTVQLPENIKRVHIMADLDVSGTGERVGRELVQRLISEGKTVKLILPAGPISPGKKSVDWLDIYLNEQEAVA